MGAIVVMDKTLTLIGSFRGHLSLELQASKYPVQTSSLSTAMQYLANDEGKGWRNTRGNVQTSLSYTASAMTTKGKARDDRQIADELKLFALEDVLHARPCLRALPTHRADISA
jgi:hypothetical protein